MRTRHPSHRKASAINLEQLLSNPRVSEQRSLLGGSMAAAFFGTLIWMGIDYGVVAKDSPRTITYVSIVAVAAFLTLRGGGCDACCRLSRASCLAS